MVEVLSKFRETGCVRHVQHLNWKESKTAPPHGGKIADGYLLIAALLLRRSACSCFWLDWRFRCVNWLKQSLEEKRLVLSRISTLSTAFLFPFAQKMLVYTHIPRKQEFCRQRLHQKNMSVLCQLTFVMAGTITTCGQLWKNNESSSQSLPACRVFDSSFSHQRRILNYSHTRSSVWQWQRCRKLVLLRTGHSQAYKGGAFLNLYCENHNCYP